MSRFRKLPQTLWHCQYHIVWVPQYRYRILAGKIADLVEHGVRAFTKQFGAEVIELNVQPDHVHLLVMAQPKVSISGYVGTIKGRTAIKVLNRYRELKEKPYGGNHFWARGYIKAWPSGTGCLLQFHLCTAWGCSLRPSPNGYCIHSVQMLSYMISHLWS